MFRKHPKEKGVVYDEAFYDDEPWGPGCLFVVFVTAVLWILGLYMFFVVMY
jgi:hypothetical protein